MKVFIYGVLLAVGLLEITARRHHAPNVNRLPVELYYEALCPYCMEFVTTQLNPSMGRKDRLAFTELTLVPYGNAKRNESGEIDCQHGVQECELNAWHACILENHNISDSLKLIACMMRGKKNRLNQCASRHNIDVSSVKNCKNSRTISQILKKYADLTDKVKHKGVPAVAIDNVYNESEQEIISEHFDNVFCVKYEEKFNKTLDRCQEIN